MRKLPVYLSVIVLLTALLRTASTLAVGPTTIDLRLTATPTATVADNSSTITFTLYGFNTQNGTEIPDCYDIPEDISVSGEGNTLSATQVNLITNGNPDGNNCQASFTLKSSVAGVKDVHVQNDAWPTQEFTDVSVTFTAAPSQPATVPKTPAANPKPQYTVTLPSSTGLTLWNGSNFGLQGQALAGSTSASTAVGIADKNNTPLAEVMVNLSSAQDWSKISLTYGSDSVAHKAYVHGLTSAPGVVGSTFTLYVPYHANDHFVGICPGATSLGAVNSGCPGIYYVKSGQTKSHADSSSIAAGNTVKAAVVTVGPQQYWTISGLGGTGGFSTAAIPVPVSQAVVTTPAKSQKSNTFLYIAITAAMLVAAALAASYKLWWPKVKSLKRPSQKDGPTELPTDPTSTDSSSPTAGV